MDTDSSLRETVAVQSTAVISPNHLINPVVA
jgi:hypothetical protein